MEMRKFCKTQFNEMFAQRYNDILTYSSLLSLTLFEEMFQCNFN